MSIPSCCVSSQYLFVEEISVPRSLAPTSVSWLVSYYHFQISTLSVSVDPHGALVDHEYFIYWGQILSTQSLPSLRFFLALRVYFLQLNLDQPNVLIFLLSFQS